MMQRHLSIRSARAASAAAGLMILTLPALAQAPKIGDPPEARNMRLVGYNDLHGRSAYQPTIHHQGSRYIAYVGHHGGTPEVPRPVNRLTGQAENNGTSIVDVTDPAKPALLTKIVEGLKDTHKSWWECDTGIAYLVSGVEGWRVKRMTQVFDLSDPSKPVHIRDFGLVGQEPGAAGAVPTELHGPISTGPQGNRVYFGYGTNKGGVLQIVDREKLLNGPKEPTVENLRYPVVGQLDMLPFNGAHTVVPMLKMSIAEFAKDKDGKVLDFVMIVDEQILNECQEARQLVFFVDVTIESRPMVVSNFSVPEASGNFCQRGGRFGSHSSNESMAPVFYKKIAFIAYFNAGVRAVDVRNPYQPKEVGYFIPSITEATDKRCIKVDGVDRCKTAIQSNNVETDDRGYIYVVDRANTGMHILELTGEARAIAGLQ